MTYAEMLKDPRWQKKRLEILERDGWACQLCEDTSSTLHVHHKLYNKEKAPWEYENRHLVTLCESCHENEKDELKKLQHVLVSTLKENGAMSEDFLDLAGSLCCLSTRTPYHPSLVLSAISWAISGRMLGDILDAYIEKKGHTEYFKMLSARKDK